MASRRLIALTGLAAAAVATGAWVADSPTAAPRIDVAAVLASVPATYSPAGRYIAPPTSNIRPPKIKLDHGIPIVNYGGTYEHNPVTTAQYGLYAYGRYLAGDRHALKTIRHVANWLVSRQDKKGRWLYTFPFRLPGGAVDPPWPSAMAQGQAMSLLERAYRATRDRRYLTAAIRALHPLETPIARGGLKRCFDGDCAFPFLEEYPTAPPSYVLNGFMFTIIGLYDLASVAPRTASHDLYLACRRTLRHVLHLYDHDGLATYDLASHEVADSGYQAIHIYLLRTLDQLHPDAILHRYALRWEAHAVKG